MSNRTNRTLCEFAPSLAVLLMLALLGAVASSSTSQASDARHEGARGDHDRARQALEAGEVLPLRTLLERVEHDYAGQIMEVELERKATGWIYEVKLLKSGGALVKLKMDARTGTVLDSKEKHNIRRRPEEAH